MRRFLILLALILAAAPTDSWAYAVGPAVPLDKMTAEADLVVKATVVSGQAVADDWFKPVPGFQAWETTLKIVSVIKGEAALTSIRFRHYTEKKEDGGFMYMPWHCEFETGRAYLVFAKQGGEAGLFRQLWPNHTGKEDQGLLACADDHPGPAGLDVEKTFWGELLALLKSPDPARVAYGIGQIDQMSRGGEDFSGTSDFPRSEALEAVHGLINHTDPKVAQAALMTLGSKNPYLRDDLAQFWLATVGERDNPGLGKMQKDMANPGGTQYRDELVALADKPGEAATRALAVRTLGLVRDPALVAPIRKWLADSAPPVRAAAVVLSADYPKEFAVSCYERPAADEAAEVRVAVARSVGFAQRKEAMSVLAKLLADKDEPVRSAAAMTLLSFSAQDEAVARLFTAQLKNQEFQPLFLLALAEVDPAAHLDELAEAIEKKLEPAHYWGGQIPAFTAWEQLFRYAQKLPKDDVTSGKFDRYLDALEKVGQYSSSEPRDLYAFYLQRGLTDRARKYREAVKKSVPYDMDMYFNQVDAHPEIYQR